MFNFKHFVLVLMLFLNACAYAPSISLIAPDQGRRKVANVEDIINVEELMKIKATSAATINTHSISKSFAHIPPTAPKGIKYVFKQDPEMPADEAFRITPSAADQKFILHILYSTAGMNDEGAADELLAFLNQINAAQVSPLSILELYYNAKEKDVTALEVLIKLRRDAALDPASKKLWIEALGELEKKSQAHREQIKTKESARKAVMDALDKVAQDQQLRTLVANNDRLGAAKLIRAYLPWEQMPPFEKRFWENHLAVMADPLPLEQRVIIYRGIDEDMLQVAIEGGKELSKEEAIKEQKIFLMSTVITKNQGTWNRRLRSLTTMYDKFIATNNLTSNEYTRAARITTMFTKHSTEPKGSPFLSLTPNFNIAKDFGHERISMYFLDPRHAYFNYTSKFSNETEFLLPLVTFPDDLAAVHDKEIHNAANIELFLRDTAINRLKEEYGEKGKEIYDRISVNTENHFRPVKFVQYGALSSSSDFFKKNLGMDTGKVAKQLSPGTDAPCMDLIQLFWK